jgi:hypothetical protein
MGDAVRTVVAMTLALGLFLAACMAPEGCARGAEPSIAGALDAAGSAFGRCLPCTRQD